MTIEREHKLTMMISVHERALLRWLADREGLNVSDYLRTLIRHKAEQHGIVEPALVRAFPRPKRRRRP